MSDRRSYDDPCGVARALDVVGERWALLVVRELLLGPKRYTDLARGLPGSSPTVLSQRLRDLETAGIVRRSAAGPPGGGRVYELTPRGHDLEDVLVALGRWGSRTVQTSAGDLGTDAFVLALRTTADPARLAGWSARVELRVEDPAGPDRVALTVDGGRLSAVRGTAGAPDAVLAGPPAVLRAVAFGRRSLDAALDDGAVRIEGDDAAVRRLLAAVVPPVPA
ncbi:DNA-binding HxlR family transcriptional regulator [Geodermatophilus bullaregiensis]|uniref:winged helix-turn-helix transcriptional regulator n=1 Tax=Geodermatophilus bullaregiensis TaxID=1564160 RepID=UPI001959B2B3|nr:winged helix-turn-helix transcriptional regulator [Geodermatophilus bullaregiensis]MBM7804593.1 DNA-binding HxlR family transcriptional regulator [Geodermatophilus bullaregiensis]